MVKTGDKVKVINKKTGEETTGFVKLSSKDVLILNNDDRFVNDDIEIIKI